MGLRQQGSGKLPRRFRRAAKGKNHSSGAEAWGSRWRGVGRGAITESSSDDPWPPRHTVRAARCLSSLMAGIGLSSGQQHARRRRPRGKLPATDSGFPPMTEAAGAAHHPRAAASPHPGAARLRPRAAAPRGCGRGERRRVLRSRSPVPQLPPADRLAWPGSPVVHAATERDEAGGAAVGNGAGVAPSWGRSRSRSGLLAGLGGRNRLPAAGTHALVWGQKGGLGGKGPPGWEGAPGFHHRARTAAVWLTVGRRDPHLKGFWSSLVLKAKRHFKGGSWVFLEIPFSVFIRGVVWS